MPSRLASFLALALAGANFAARAADSPHGLEFFEKRIRPLLAEHCYECHSASAKKLKGGLRLDTREGWAKGGDSGPAIVAGEPDRSLLIQAVRWSDPGTQMPPKNKLASDQIAALEQWVTMGAPDPRVDESSRLKAQTSDSPSAKTNHWAYQPVRRPSVPEVANTNWPRTDIDRFILARLETHRVSPAPDAGLAALCRRLHFDLTGLPPSPEELDAFTQSAHRNRQAAVTELTDRLLTSPRFGEHWARHWFDAVRFGESLTLRGFIYKEAWRYRDYVIEALNADRPYDQFLREHIAGDLLPHGTLDQRRRQLAATTFLAMGNWNLEEQDKKLLRMDIVDEQLDTIGKAFLGQTIGCARCHDHKFDPIPARDYYALAGILRNTRTVTNANVSGWLEVPLPIEPAQEHALREHESAIAALQKEIKAAKDAAKALASKSGETTGTNKASVIAPRELAGIVVDSAQARAVGVWKHSQYSKHYIGEGYWHDDNKEKGEKTLTFAPELPRAGRYEVRLAYIHAPSRSDRVPVTVFHADGETVVHVNQQEAPVLDGRFVSLGTFRFETNGFAYALVSNEGTQGFVTADAVQFLAEDTADTGSTKRSSHPTNAVEARATELKALEARLKHLQDSGPKRPRVLSVIEEEKIEDAFIHIRGSPHNPGAAAPRGFLTFGQPVSQHRLPAAESGRRQLADWIASPSNPLTVRVYVNRVWHWLMGEGIVPTVDNFGTTGETPTQPELLDYLAARFVAEGWSTKRLVRKIVLSHRYQQTTRRRFTAEQLRDTILSVSGQLQRDAPRGPTYPASLSADFGFQSSNSFRSVFLPVFRNALPPLFEAFDFAPPTMVMGRRNVSTVPTQALFLLNHPWVREQAQAAARRALAEPAFDESARLDRAYQRALGRHPTTAERTLAQQHLATAASATAREEAWTALFHALFACADFRYLD